MWSNRVYSECPHPCGHFDTKIEVVTMKYISARFFPTLLTQSVIQSTESLLSDSFGAQDCTFWEKHFNNDG